MSKRIMLILSLCLAMAALSAAKVRPIRVEAPPEELPAPFRVAASFLQLSEEQLAQLLELRTHFEPDLQELQRGLQELEQALNQRLADPSSDAASIGEVVLQIREVKQGLLQRQSEFIGAFAELLDEEQRARLHLVHRASELQGILPAFQAVGLLPAHP